MGLLSFGLCVILIKVRNSVGEGTLKIPNWLFTVLLVGLFAIGCGETRVAEPFNSQRTYAAVVRVIDGDTIEVRIDTKLYKVRYIGMNTPETVDPRRPVQCFGQEASKKNKQLVSEKIVELEKDVSETDRYGRLLRYVYVNGVMMNAELVRLGYARATSYPPDVRHQDTFKKLEAEARNAGRGLWASNACPKSQKKLD